MANDYVDEIQKKIQFIKSQINVTLKSLYSPKPVVSKERWLKSKETAYVNTVTSLIAQYKSVVESMKQSFWGIDYKSGIVEGYNRFIVGTNNQHRYYRDGYTESLIDPNGYGKVNQSVYSSVFKTQQSLHEVRIKTVKSHLDHGDYLNAMSIGFVQLHFSMWALAESRYIGVAEFLEMKKSYYRLARYFCMDVLCAECYFYKRINKVNLIERALLEYFDNYLIDKTTKDLNTLSSALNWMGVSDGERMVLEYMEDECHPLNAERKSRLKQLKQEDLNQFNDQFDISSGNEKMYREIESMRTSIMAYFTRLDSEPVSYEAYLKNLPKYGEICFVAAALKVIKAENKYAALRDCLTNSELQRLDKMLYDYTNFKNKAIAFVPVSMYYYEALNQQYMHEVMMCSDAEIQKELKEIQQILDTKADEKNWTKIWKLDLNEIVKWAWYYAIYASIEKFMDVKSLFNRLKRYFSIDMFICELELKIRTQGKEVIQFAVESYMKNNECVKTQKDLEVLTAFLRYHELEKIEKSTLKYMVDHQMPLDQLRAKRLYYLSNHKENAPKQFDVKSNDQKSKEKTIHFDVSSIDWREDNVNDFFKELDLNQKVLDYSLALSMEDNHLMLSKGIVLPELNALCERLNQEYDDEYGEEEIVAESVQATILSDVNEEISGIQISIRECPTMNLLVHLMKIGKKLNIRFYTLYTPGDSDGKTQKSQCLAMIKKISPSLSVWEKSVKDTTQLSLQHVLNSSSISGSQKKKMEETEF